MRLRRQRQPSPLAQQHGRHHGTAIHSPFWNALYSDPGGATCLYSAWACDDEWGVQFSTEQSRAEQSRAEQSRAEQSRAGQVTTLSTLRDSYTSPAQQSVHRGRCIRTRFRRYAVDRMTMKNSSMDTRAVKP
jgi:hypothetical protein